MTTEKLTEILENYKKWLNGEPGGIRADLSGADLSGADLGVADLSGADLRSADLSYADLSGAKGLLSAIDFMAANFERTNDGYIAYKTFGAQYKPPKTWKIESDSIITENVIFHVRKIAEAELTSRRWNGLRKTIRAIYGKY